MSKKRIIIISAVFFPRNSPRANRTTELAKELARQGHIVTIYAVLGHYDYTSFEKKYNVKVRNLGKMRFAVLNSDQVPPPHNLLTRIISKFFRKSLDFPDIELSFKVNRVLKKQQIQSDLLITIAFPFSIHWGAAYAKNRMKNFPVTWIADCGDPYMGNSGVTHPFYFKYVEKWFCRKTNYISVPTVESVNGYYDEFHSKIRVIPQGFNFTDYDNLPNYVENKIPTFIYAGALYSGIRDPRPFLEYLTTIRKDFKFIIYTKSNHLIKEYIDKLKDKMEIRDYIPRREVINEFAKADFLINFENTNKVQTPSKLIDYALAKRPILSIDNSLGSFKVFEEFCNQDYRNQIAIENVDQYNIKNIAKSFIQLK